MLLKLMLLAPVYLTLSFSASAATLEVVIEDDRVYLEAENVSLISVLRRFSKIAGVELHSGVPLTNPVSLSINGHSVEETAKRILSDQSYLFAYRERNAVAVLSGIEVLSTTDDPGDFGILPVVQSRVEKAPGIAKTIEPKERKPASTRKIGGIRVVDRQSVRHEIESLAEEVRLEKALKSAGGPRQLSNSMTLSKVAEGSAFQQIGLEAGDRIQNVNGQSITNKSEFVEALTTASKESMIRIKLQDHDEPIYLDLGESEESPGS